MKWLSRLGAVILLMIPFFTLFVFAEDEQALIVSLSEEQTYTEQVSIMVGSRYMIADGVQIPFDENNTDIRPILYKGTTFVPLRFLSDLLSLDLTYQSNQQPIYVTDRDRSVRIQLNTPHIWLNDELVQLSAAPHIRDGRVYVPLRAIVEAFDQEISMDGDIVTIANRYVTLASDTQEQYEQLLLEGFPYVVHLQGQLIGGFQTPVDAISYARQEENAQVFYNGQLLFTNKSLPEKYWIGGVPLILQMPQLDRGCEVTSLAMLLQHAGIEADKMTLAKEIKKDPTPYQRKNGGVYFGNPNDGFVGDIYSFSNPGLGVYHEPIAELAERYAPDRVVDLTGTDFDSILYQVSRGRPVWVIQNTNYALLSAEHWSEWDTPSGKIDITYKEHSVVIIGYDDTTVYFRDPLGARSKASRSAFDKGWKQMGKQAIVIMP